MSKYIDQVKEHVNQKDTVLPTSQKAEVLSRFSCLNLYPPFSFLYLWLIQILLSLILPSPLSKNRLENEQEVGDLSISRASFSWGIPVPKQQEGEEQHVMYVWFEALMNYLTGFLFTLLSAFLLSYLIPCRSQLFPLLSLHSSPLAPKYANYWARYYLVPLCHPSLNAPLPLSSSSQDSWGAWICGGGRRKEDE